MKGFQGVKARLDGFWILAVLALSVYSSGWVAEYVTWDDPVLLVENPLLELSFFKALGEFFRGFYHGDYMPLTLLSYWAEVAVFGKNPSVSHGLNLLLHLGSAWVLFEILKRLRLSQEVSLWVVLFFLLHPLQVESVMWVSERKGLLSTWFLLLAVSFSVSLNPAQENQKGLGDSVRPNSTDSLTVRQMGYLGCFIASLLCKATGVLIPAVLAFWDYRGLGGQGRIGWRDLLKKHALALGASGIIITIRILAYGNQVSHFSQALWSWDRLLSLPLQGISILGFYLQSFVFPHSLSIIYPEFRMDLQFWIRSVFFLCGLAWVGFEVRKKEPGLVLSFFLFSFCCLLPVLQLIPRINFVNDRYFYLPMIGLSAVLGLRLEAILGQKKLRLLMVGVALIFVPLSFFRALVWGDDLSLWGNTVSVAPWSALAHNNLGITYESQKKMREAQREYEIAAELGKKDGLSHLAFHNLGVLHSSDPDLFDLPRAIEEYQKSIEFSKRTEDTFATRMNLAALYAQLGKKKESLEILSRLEKEISSSTQDKKYLQILMQTQVLQEKIRNLPFSERF